MPTYQYSCQLSIKEGGHGEFEEFHSIRDDAKLTECPYCRKEKNICVEVQRLVSGGVGRHIVEQTVAELKANMPNEVRKINQRAMRDETFAANLIGKNYRGQ